MNETGLTKLGMIVVPVLIVGLIVGGYFLAKQKSSNAKLTKTIDMDEAQKKMNSPAPVTTISEFEYVGKENLPPVKGVSGYKWDKSDPVVKWPINVWVGWLPVVAANGGFAPNTNSIFYKETGVKVEIILIDDPVMARDTFVSGDSHILWGTLDMLTLFAPELMKDSRTSPRIVQQIDWSSGGDGIVARSDIKSVNDLQGKTIVYAQNSPSEYYLNTVLLSSGVQPNRVSHMYTRSAFEASAAFVKDTNIDACVSWAPDIYNITDQVSGTKLLSTTSDASKVIADVWAVRADFEKDHSKIVKGLVTAVFKAMAKLDSDEEFKSKAIQWLAKGYGFPEEEINGMLQDAHMTNFAENKSFFLDAKNPTNFCRTWDRASYVYKELNRINGTTTYDKVMDASFIKGLSDEGAFPDQIDMYSSTFNPSDKHRIAESPILIQTIRIHFAPNSSVLMSKGPDGELYDQSIPQKIEQVSELAGQFDHCLIKIVGHTDASREGEIPEEWVTDLSEDRAASVVAAIIDKFGFQKDKFVAEGRGWSDPIDGNKNDYDSNRRVEINVFSIEQE